MRINITYESKHLEVEYLINDSETVITAIYAGGIDIEDWLVQSVSDKIYELTEHAIAQNHFENTERK